MAQTEVGAKFAECLFAVGHSAGSHHMMAGRDIACAVDAYQPVHLIGNADGGYVAGSTFDSAMMASVASRRCFHHSECAVRPSLCAPR